jgi:hypothetical protein
MCLCKCRDEFTNFMFLQKAQAAGDEGDADNWRLFPADFRNKTSATSMHHEQVRSSRHTASRFTGAVVNVTAAAFASCRNISTANAVPAYQQDNRPCDECAVPAVPGVDAPQHESVSAAGGGYS